MSSKKVDMFIRMLGDPDHRMRAIQKIEALGAAAHEAVPELWNVVMDQNGEPQVRAAALKAIVTISGENPQTAEGLIDRLAHDPASEVVLQAAQSLEDYGTILKRKLPKLWEILERERNINYRFAIARAIIRIDGNKKKMLEQVMQALKQPGEHLWAMMAILSELELSDAETNQALEVLWDVMRQNQPLEVVDPTFLAIVDLTADDDAVLEKLLNDDKIDAQTRVFAIIEPKLWNNVTDAFIKASNDRLLLSAMLEALKLEDKDVNRDSRRSYWDKLDLIRRDVIGLLKGVKKNVFDNDVLSEVRAAVETCLEETGVGLGFIYNYDADDARQWLRDHRKPFPGVGEFLLREADDNFRDEQWENDTEATLGHIIQVITKSNEADWQLLSKGVDQLKAKRTEISLKLCKMVKPDLEAAEKAASEGSNRKYYAAQALDVIKQRQDKLEKEDLLDDIQQEDKKDEGERIKKIRQLVDSESPESLRGLVDIWIKWMVNNEHSAAVETIAVLMRESPMAVAPLVDQLVKNLPIDAQIRARVLNEIGAQESQVHRALEKLLNLETQEDEITPVDEHYISE
jgi:hypothetical protein